MAKAIFANNKKVAIIGSGHMGHALALGLLRGGTVRSDNIIVSDPHESKLRHLKQKGLQVTSDNEKAIAFADIILVAVKPRSIKEVIQGLQDRKCDKLVVSCAAAVRMRELQRYSSPGQKLARIMPNIPVVHNEGVIGLYTEGNLKASEKAALVQILSSLGLVVDVEREKDIELLTLLSACGPAIVAYLMSIITAYAQQKGISKIESEKIVMQTFNGTLRYLGESKVLPQRLVESVATKGGVTEAILKVLRGKLFESEFRRAMERGRSKIKTLQSS